MIVVVIIGILAAIVIPALHRASARSQINPFANDLRVGRDGLETDALSNGAGPPDDASGMPVEVDGYVSRAKLNRHPPLGGTWDWDGGGFAYPAGLSVRNPTADRDPRCTWSVNPLLTGTFQPGISDPGAEATLTS